MSAADSTLVTCPACQSSLPVPVQQLGKKIRCGKCNQVFQAPAATELPAVSPTPLPEEENPFALTGAAHAALDEQEGTEPRHQLRNVESKKGIGAPVMIGIAVLGLVLVGGAAFGIRYALKEKEPVKSVEASGKEKEPLPKPKDKEKPKGPELVTTADGKMTDSVRERVKGSTVYIRTRIDDNKLMTGTGFFTAAPGLVVTNAHVIGQTQSKIENVKLIEVVLNSGQPDSQAFQARVLKADRRLDLALLKIDMPNRQPPQLEVIDSFDLKETQPVYIFGFPGGEALGRSISVNISTISSFRRERGDSWIQVAGGMYKGNSGGPVTDVYGRVVGVCRAIIVDSPINMAIPGDVVHSFLHNAGDLVPKNGK